MLPSLILRLTAQHRALYCYLILSVWIFLLLGGMYKYIGNDDGTLAVLKQSVSDVTTRGFSKNIRPDIKTKRVIKLCNPPQEISIGCEGQLAGNYSLAGVLILFRHGDRGPLNHIRNVSSVNCAGASDPLVDSYYSFIENMTAGGSLGQVLGPFHGIPPVPTLGTQCALGQLTRQGVAQLLAVGRILRSAYGSLFNNLNLTSSDLLVYSTRYRRTVQSALAFLYSFLTPDNFGRVTFKESHSVTFCFDDCACPSIDLYASRFHVETSKHLLSHPAVGKLVRSAASIVYEILDQRLLTNPYSLRDALLAYVCHGARLPCLDSLPGACVRTEDITGLFAYLEWETRQYTKSGNLRRHGLLSSYGLVRNLVSHMLRLISDKKPRFVIYSGHDKTIADIASALGVNSEATFTPHYAARFVLEVYRGKEVITLADKATIGSDYFFRLVYNGKDMTNRIKFCKGAASFPVLLSEGSPQTGPKSKKQSLPAYLCPIESIIRFLHDDYFYPLNSTNLKDACTTRQ